MTENHNEMFFAHLKMAWEHLLQLPLWRMLLYWALFVFTDGVILLAITCYWAIKGVISSIKELKHLNKQLKQLKKELEKLQNGEEIHQDLGKND